MKICPNCGQQLADDVNFCGHCGSTVPAQQQPIQATPQPQQPTLQDQLQHGYQQAVNSYQQNVAPALQAGTARFEQYAAPAIHNAFEALKEPRVGQGVYAVVTIARILLFQLISALLIYSAIDNLVNLAQMFSFGGRASGTPSLPTLTPFYFLAVADYAFIVFLLFKRLKDTGAEQTIVAAVTGIYAALAAYAIYSINSALDKIMTGIFGSMAGGLAAGKGFMDILTSANDLSFAFKIMLVLDLLALLAAFQKGSAGDNQHGPKPTQL